MQEAEDEEKAKKDEEKQEVRAYRGYLGLYWGYIEIMEKKMETTRV